MSGEVPIFHVALAADWAAAQAAGSYRVSTVGQSLDDVGFIHCSQVHQVAPSANRYYAGRTDLVLLTIDPAAVEPEIRHENLHGGDDLFPHIYGPLDPDAVTDAVAFLPDDLGVFHFPA